MHSSLLLRTIVLVLVAAPTTSTLFQLFFELFARDKINAARPSSRMQQKIALSCMVLTMLAVIAAQSPTADAAPYTHQSYWNQLEQEDPEALDDMLVRLERTLMLENNKRGLDLGLSRGFSGSQAAKHLMGLAAANYAGGPGRRRRSEQA